jgi:hypothetical protein
MLGLARDLYGFKTNNNNIYDSGQLPFKMLLLSRGRWIVAAVVMVLSQSHEYL